MRYVWIALTVVFGTFSLYGLWFHFNVGPTHGAGAEIFIVSGGLALMTGVLIILQRKFDRES